MLGFVSGSICYFSLPAPPWTQKNDYNQMEGSSFTPISLPFANLWLDFVDSTVLLLTCVSLLNGRGPRTVSEVPPYLILFRLSSG